jgi:hypothetical protein
MRAHLVAAAGLLLACAPGLKSAAGTPDAAAERIYRGHCAACHPLRDPSELPPERWPRAVEEYGRRAHLTEEERRLVLGWLQDRSREALRKDGGAP